MKIIISSKTLAGYLHAFNFAEYPVDEVSYQNGKLTIEAHDYTADIDCHLTVDTPEVAVTFNQREVRWDWLEKAVRVISEQPIVLEIGDNRLNLILSF